MTEYLDSVNGLTIPSVTEIEAELASAFATQLDPNVNTSPDSPLGQMIGIFADRERQLWEALLIAYNGFNPDAAEGFLLDALCALTGVSRNAPNPSFFSGVRRVLVQLNPAVTLPVGTLFGVPGTSTQFQVSVPFSSPSTGPSPGWYALELCQCTAIDPATGDVGGPVTCNAGTLTLIVTPITGLLQVSNTAQYWNPVTLALSGSPAPGYVAVGGDAYLGTILETDIAERLRREQTLRATGNATIDAIRAKILEITVNEVQTVIACTVFDNDQDIPDQVTGLLPHSIEVLLYDGLGTPTPSNTIAQTIWDSKPGGTRVLGNSSGVAIDLAGGHHTVLFSRPATIEITIAVSLHVNASFDATGATTKADMVAALAAQANSVFANQTLYWSAFVPVLLAEPGVIGVESVAFNGGAANTDLLAGLREVTYCQTSDVTVNLV